MFANIAPVIGEKESNELIILQRQFHVAVAMQIPSIHHDSSVTTGPAIAEC